MNAPRLILILLVLSGFVFAVNVNSCQNIGVSGVYDLTNNLAGEPVAAGDIYVNWDACLKVSVSDVVIDCHGYTITGSTRNDTMGIGLLASRTNVTIRNCPNITNYDYGIHFGSDTYVQIQNTTVYDNERGVNTFSAANAYVLINNSRAIKNTWGGFFLYQDDYVTINNCTAEDSYIGFNCQFCEHGTFTNNIGRDHTNPSLGGYAVQEYRGYNNTWENNEFYNNYYYGIYVGDGENITIRGNTIYNNTERGIHVIGTTNYSLIEDNTIYDVGLSGTYLGESANNNNFVNNRVNDTLWGYYFGGGTANTFTGNNATGTTQAAFMVAASTGNVLQDNLVYSSSVGFSLRDDNNTVDGNTVYDCASGIEVEGVNGSIVRNNNVWDIGNQGYWSLGGAENSTFINNTARNTSIGFEMYGSGNYLADNTAYDNTGFYGNGFHVYGSDNVYENNTAYNNQNNGFFIAYTSDVNLSDNTAYGNDRGIYVQGVNNTRLSGDRMYNNGYDLFLNGSTIEVYASNIIFDNPAGNYTWFTNLSFNDTLGAGAPSIYSINWSTNSSVPPASSFEGKLVDISTQGGGIASIDSLVWHWTDAESSGYSEPTFVILKYNGTWNDEGAALDTGANTLTLTNVNPASDYGIFGASGSGIPLSSCQLINSPGFYNVTGSFSGTTSNYWYATYTTCVLVQDTANVTIDCNNYTITETGGGSGAPIGIRNSTNVTVMNCNLTGARGLGMYQASANTVMDSEFHANWALTGVGTNPNNNFIGNELYPGTYGFFGVAEQSYYAYNNVYGPSSSGFYLSGENSTVEHNNVFNAGYVGYAISSGASRNNFTNNTAQNSSQHGFHIEGSSNRFIDNWALDSGQHGFFIEHGDNNYMEGSVAQFSGMDGFRIDDVPLMGTNNTIADSLAQHNAGNGFTVFYSSYDTLINDTAYNNSGNGFMLLYTAFINVTDCNASDNQLHGIAINESNYSVVDPSYFCDNSLSGMSSYNTTNLSVFDSVFCNNTLNGADIEEATNLTLDNNTAYDNTIGYNLSAVFFSSVTDNVAHDNNDSGFDFGGGYSLISGNTAYLNGDDGLAMVLLESNVTHNVAYNNSNYGLLVDADDNELTLKGDSVLYNNTAYYNDGGIGLFGENLSNYSFISNHVYENNVQGIGLLGGENNTLMNNRVNDNSVVGILLGNSSNNTLENNTVNGSGLGIAITSDADLNELFDNTVYGNTNAGVLIQASNGTVLTGDHLYNNGADYYVNGTGITADIFNVIFDSDGTFTNYTNLSVIDNVASAYSIDWNMQPAALPVTYVPFEGKWVNITNMTPGVSIDNIIWHWTDAEAASYDEDALEILMYDGSWNSLNDTPDTGNNELSLSGLNPASIYGLAMLNATECMEITSPGAYVLKNNLTGAPIDASEIPWGPTNVCIKIASSDVILDCAGYSITNNGTTQAAAVLVNGTSGGMLDNITVRNCDLHDYEMGFLGWYATNGLVEDNNATNISWMGFQFNAGNTDSMLRNRVVQSLGGFGVDVSGTGNTVQDNYAQAGSGAHGTVGYWFNMSDTLVDNNTAIGFYRNFRFNMGQNNTATNNLARDGSSVGYLISNNYSRFVNNTAYNHTEECFRLDPIIAGPNYPTYGNNLTNNSARNCSMGFYLNQATGNLLYLNRAYDNNVSGFRLYYSDNNNLTNNSAWNNTLRGFHLVHSDNNTVLNCTSSADAGGFYTESGSGNVFLNDTAQGMTNDGFFVTASTNTSILGSEAYLCDNGFYVTGSPNSTLEENAAHNNTNHGYVIISNSDGTDFLNNTAYWNGWAAVLLQSSQNCLLGGNLAYENLYGYWVTSVANYNTIINNTARDNSNRGFYVSSNADNNEFIGNFAYRNQMGFATWTSANNNTFTNNTAHSNSDYGFFMSSSNNTKFYNSYAYNNTDADLEVSMLLYPLDFGLTVSNFTVDNPSGGFQNYTSFDINDVVQGLTEYRIVWTSQPAALPANVDSFENKWLEIDNMSAIVNIDQFVWHWTDAEAASYDESLLEVWKHDGAEYSRTGATLNEGANTLTINNLNPASDYGIVENNITYCMDITSSGLYQLNNDLAGAPISAAPRPGTTCIKVSASDVIVDCQGYTIANNGTAGTTRAILAVNGLDNVTVRNCNLANYTINLEYYQAEEGLIDNTTSYNSAAYGFYLNEADNNTVTRSVADTSGTHGFFTDDATYNNLTNNTAFNIGSSAFYISPNSHSSYVADNIAHEAGNGFYVQASQNCLVTDNLAYNNTNGFYIWTNFYGSAFDNVFNNNLAHDNAFEGFNIYTNRNNFTNNTAYNNGRYGFQATFGTHNFVDNTAYGNTQAGFYANLLDDSAISGLTSYSNGIYGIRSRDAENNVYTDTLLYNNSRDFEMDNGGGSSYWVNMTNTTFREPGGSATNHTSMSMNDSVPTTTSNYRISWSAQPAALPGNYSSFAGKFVNITEAVGSVTLDSVAFHWDAAESAGVDESYFRLLHHDGSWNEVPNQILDEGNNEITATNVNDFSVYGIIMYNDTNVSALKLDQTAGLPSQGGLVEFNITVTNTGNVTLDPAEVVDVLPVGLTYSAASPTPDNVAGQTLTWDNVGPIGPGSAVTIMVNATADYGYSGVLTNYVNVTGQPPLGDNVTAEDYENVTVYTANISVLKVDMTPLVVSPGGLVEWLINITNSGEVYLGPVMVSDTLPAGFAYDSASPAADSTAGPVVWDDVGPIGNGSSFQIYLNTTVAGNVSNGTYYNFVEVEGQPPNGDNVTDNDTAMIGIYAPGISLTKSAEYASVKFGQNVTYILNIVNTGSVDVNLTVQDILPGNMSFEGATVAPSSVAGQTVTWDNYMVLPVGNATEIRYNTSVNVTGVFDNNVTVWAVPPNGDNVTDNDSVTVYVTDEEDTDPKPEPKSFTVGFTSNCEGNTVKVIGASPSSGFQVFVDKASTLEEIASGTTDSDGEFTFAGCGLELRILVKKSDYSSQTVYKTMVPCVDCELECAEDSDCEDNEQCEDNFCESVGCPCGTVSDHQCVEYECCLDSDCEEGQSCQDNICTYECASDNDCGDTQYCDIAEGASGGSCEDVSGQCGFASNHTWTEYECGDEEGCPQCPERYVCQDNVCEPVLDLIGPESGFVGEDVTVSATEAENACVNCPVRILLPDGTSLSGKTDSRGQLKVPLNFEGPYQLTLFEEGVPVKSIQVNSLAKPSVTPEETPTQVIDDVASLFLVILLALLLVAIIYWRRRRSRKK